MLDLGHFCLKMLLASPKCISIYGPGSHKNEGFSDFCEGWVPFLLEIKQKAGWLVGMPSFKDKSIIRFSTAIMLLIPSLVYLYIDGQ